MSYESPIELIARSVETQIEDDTVKCVQSYGIDVDKEELLKALEYDRRQYEKGYAEGRAATAWEMSEIIAAQQSRIEELEKLTLREEEINKAFDLVSIIICGEVKRLNQSRRRFEAEELDDALTIIMDNRPQQGEKAE